MFTRALRMWAMTIALGVAALRAAPGSARATAAFASAGVLAGVGASAKVTGVALPLALILAYASKSARPHARTFAPWAGLIAGLLIVVPVVRFEVQQGWPMLQHRLVDTQESAGFSLRNLGSLLGGQLLYLSPLLAWLLVGAGRAAWRDRRDAVGRLLLSCVLMPLPPLVLLCLWSRVAEPHWIAPALLALGPAAARSPSAPSRRLVLATSAAAALMVVGVHAWTLVPRMTELAAADANPRLDLTHELFGWPRVITAVREEAGAFWSPDDQRGDLVVVGPHWVICAQLEAALRERWPVGCNTPIRDDFDDWWPRKLWHEAQFVVWVSDTRFDPAGSAPSYAPLLVSHTPIRSRQVSVQRDGRQVRLFTVTVLSRLGRA